MFVRRGFFIFIFGILIIGKVKDGNDGERWS